MYIYIFIIYIYIYINYIVVYIVLITLQPFPKYNFSKIVPKNK